MLLRNVYLHWLRNTVKASLDAIVPSITINDITYMIDQRILRKHKMNENQQFIERITEIPQEINR